MQDSSYKYKSTELFEPLPVTFEDSFPNGGSICKSLPASAFSADLHALPYIGYINI